MLYLFLSVLFFIGDKIASDCFKYEITPSLNLNDRIKFPQYGVLNRVQDNGKLGCKLSYKLLEKEDGYYPLLKISKYPTLIQLKYFRGGIHHCVKVVVK